ncbi:MAG: LysR family transcriptional regulator [Rhodococcus sp. (in: high G+C Gram-positive bacteria)]|jgi:DNA-binding transcriptional LysR family regulator|nr:LysR family transcriptional regulator [Rhodococcus sp. (in: high G+C Gram-positive bacteria)]MDI6627571.1 LysR family transcriptional regulator [Rhodococcus sp. (in: high G+C Gram-positive bacteria)]
MDVELSLLKLLVEIDRCGSMTAAAERLTYTPSAVSQQVKRLEAVVGTPVLERHARGVRLTEAGRLVAGRAAAIDTQLSALRADLDDLLDARSGNVTLGVFPSFAASLLPDVMAAFRSAHPGIDLRIRSSRLRDLHAMLLGREVDLSLAWDYPELPMVVDDVETEVIADDATVLLVPAGWSRRGPLRLESLEDEQWIVRASQHSITTMFRSACFKAGFEPKVLVESNDYMESQAMVAAGLGLTVAPSMTTRYLREGVESIALNELSRRRILLCRLGHRTPSPASDAMRAVLVTLFQAVNST